MLKQSLLLLQFPFQVIARLSVVQFEARGDLDPRGRCILSLAAFLVFLTTAAEARLIGPGNLRAPYWNAIASLCLPHGLEKSKAVLGFPGNAPLARHVAGKIEALRCITRGCRY